MKYHLVPTQMVDIDGYISDEVSTMEEYAGEFHHNQILYKPGFMNYHHSDGFNYIRIALEQRIPFWNSVNEKFRLAANVSASAGTMMTWTDFTFFGEHHRNKPHFAGYGVSINMGIRAEFFHYVFLQLNAQSGWSNLTNIMLEDDLPSRASQKISFFERSISVGGYIPLAVFKKKETE